MPRSSRGGTLLFLPGIGGIGHVVTMEEHRNLVRNGHPCCLMPDSEPPIDNVHRDGAELEGVNADVELVSVGSMIPGSMATTPTCLAHVRSILLELNEVADVVDPLNAEIQGGMS